MRSKFFEKRLRELDDEVASAGVPGNPGNLVNLAVGYNDLANQLDQNSGEERELWRRLKGKAAACYERVGDQMDFGNATLLSVLFYIQAGDNPRAKRLLRRASRKSKRAKSDSQRVDADALRVVENLLRGKADEASRVLAECERYLDPILADVLEQTISFSERAFSDRP
ncbi:MAG: hypothetical protein ACTSU5_10690 [Promethearchaeota archaeon]